MKFVKDRIKASFHGEIKLKGKEHPLVSISIEGLL
jgi:hypothetical protein